MKSENAYLKDILESARLIQKYVSGIEQDEFEKDMLLQDAVVRRLEIIGEATKRLSENFRLSRPDLPWKQMAGMRDVLIHDYDTVDLDLLWDTATQSIPTLISQLELLVPPEGRESSD